MGVTNQSSTEYADQSASPVVKTPPSTLHGRVRIAHFTHVQSGAGDATSKVYLAKLPAGRVRVLGARVNISALGSSRTLDLGHLGYTGMDGVAVAADPDAFFADKDVSSAVDTVYRATAGALNPVESKDGFVVTAQVNDGTIPDTATLNGWIEYVID